MVEYRLDSRFPDSQPKGTFHCMIASLRQHFLPPKLTLSQVPSKYLAWWRWVISLNMLHIMYLAKSKGVNSFLKKKKTSEFHFIPDYHALRAKKKKIFPGDGSGCICIIWVKGKLHMIWTLYLTVLSLTSIWCLYSCWGYVLASKRAGFLSFFTWFFTGNHLWGLQGCSGQDKIIPSPHRCPWPNSQNL